MPTQEGEKQEEGGKIEWVGEHQTEDNPHDTANALTVGEKRNR